MYDLTTTQKFWYVVRKVLTSPLSLAFWVAGGVVAYGAGSLWPLILLLVLGLQAGLVISRLHNEEFLRRLFQDRQEQAETLSEQQIETLLDSMDFETRQRIRYIIQLQKEVVREARADDVQSYARQDLDRISSQLAPLLQSAVRIAQRRQQLARYLANDDERALRNYCNNLRQRIEAATDPVAKTQYEQALKAREAELATYEMIAKAMARIDSQLENVEATFASWKARVIRIKAADVAGAAQVSENLYQELDSLNSEIDLLDRSVTEALTAEEQLTSHQGAG